MDYTGKAHFQFTIICPPEAEADGDRLFGQHADWMSRTHHREGEKALLQYVVAKSHDGDGNAVYLLSEVYETAAGIADHRAQASANQEAFGDEMRAWWGKCQLIGGGDGEVLYSLW